MNEIDNILNRLLAAEKDNQLLPIDLARQNQLQQPKPSQPLPINLKRQKELEQVQKDTKNELLQKEIKKNLNILYPVLKGLEKASSVASKTDLLPINEAQAYNLIDKKNLLPMNKARTYNQLENDIRSLGSSNIMKTINDVNQAISKLPSKDQPLSKKIAEIGKNKSLTQEQKVFELIGAAQAEKEKKDVNPFISFDKSEDEKEPYLIENARSGLKTISDRLNNKNKIADILEPIDPDLKQYQEEVSKFVGKDNSKLLGNVEDILKTYEEQAPIEKPVSTEPQSLETLAEQYKQAIDKLSEEKKIDSKDLLVQAAMAIGPALLGRLIAGPRGGYYAAQHGIKALEDYQKLSREEQDKKKALAKEQIKLAYDTGVLKLKQKQELEKIIETKQAELELLPLKAQIQWQLMNGKNSPKDVAYMGDLIKFINEGEDRRVKEEIAKKAAEAKVTAATMRGTKSGSAKGGADLGYGFSMVGDQWTSKMRDNAAKRIGAMASYHSAIDDLKNSLKSGGVEGINSWTNAGRDVQQSLARFMEASRKYNESGAAFTEMEMRDARLAGFDPLGSFKDAVKMAIDPKVATRFLDNLKRNTKRQIAAELVPYSVQLSTGETPSVSPQSIDERKRAIMKKMSPQQIQQYKTGTAEQRLKILKSLGY